MKNKKQRTRKFLSISLAVAVLATITVFITTSLSPLWAYEEDPLVASATADPDEGEASLTMTFKASASGGQCDIYVYSWTGAVEGISKWITKTFKKAGTYKATVKVECGDETDTDTAIVKVTCSKQNCYDCCDKTYLPGYFGGGRRTLCYIECNNDEDSLPDKPPCCNKNL